MARAQFDPKSIAADFDTGAFDTAEEQSLIEQMAEEIDLDDPLMAASYGAGTQRGLSEVSEYLLSRANKGVQERAMRAVSQLTEQVAALSPETENQGFLSGLFKKKSKTSDLMDDLEETNLLVDRLAGQLDMARLEMMKESALLDTLYLQNKAFYHTLYRQMLAGERALSRPQTEHDSGREALRRRLYHLKTSKAISLQMAAQIRMTQFNQELMADRLRDLLSVVVPLWRQQLSLGRKIRSHRGSLEQYCDAARDTSALLRQKAQELMEMANLDNEADRESRQRSIAQDILALQESRTKVSDIQEH